MLQIQTTTLMKNSCLNNTKNINIIKRSDAGIDTENSTAYTSQTTMIMCRSLNYIYSSLNIFTMFTVIITVTCKFYIVRIFIILTVRTTQTQVSAGQLLRSARTSVKNNQFYIDI